MSCGGGSSYEVKEGKPDYAAKAKDNVLRVGAWVSPPSGNWNSSGNPDFITKENYQDIADAGINSMYALYEISNRPAITRAVQYAEEVGIKYLARDYAVMVDPVKLEYDQGDMHALTSSYDGGSAFNGFLVTDEPGANDFERLGRLKKYYEKEYPGKEFYVNLFPSYASLSQTQTDSYGEYLDRYISEVNPDFVSYDHYALSLDGYGTYHITEDVLWNLEMVSKRCQKAGIPMYTFVSTMKYDMSSRDPIENEVRWQVYTQLAYGSRSIQYFCYWTPIESDFNAYEAVITRDGKKTPRYEYLKNVNHELQGLDEALLEFDWVDTMPVKGTAHHTSEKQFGMLENPLTKSEGLGNIEASEDTLIGVFKSKDGRDGYMITNFSEPREGNDDKVSLTFLGASKALVYVNGTPEVADLNNGTLEISIVPGDGVFAIPYK